MKTNKLLLIGFCGFFLTVSCLKEEIQTEENEPVLEQQIQTRAAERTIESELSANFLKLTDGSHFSVRISHDELEVVWNPEDWIEYDDMPSRFFLDRDNAKRYAVGLVLGGDCIWVSRTDGGGYYVVPIPC